ncbi:MAG: TOTE conflict system archaeo-eukaryotic primase domain-containing protein, partial [Marvinbryantia sp.]
MALLLRIVGGGMNIEAYDAEALRKIVRLLEYENRLLKDKLKKENIPYDEINPFEETIENAEEYDLDQGARIVHPTFITEKMAIRFFSMFWGREDVYARRSKNGGYFPQCDNRWNVKLCPKQRGEKIFCDECENKKWTKLDVKKIVGHLLGYKEDGSDVIGIYPLLPDGTCRFIVFDFDNHEKGAETTDFANVDSEWHKEVDALRKICEINGIKPLVERSRSGRGAHVWIFFQKAISASVARNFGFLLLDKGAASVNLKSFHYYDRMYPSQDVASSIGNLIALPLQGQALRNGNSAFVDENWNAYPDQWDVLLNKTEKLSIEDIEKYMAKWQVELAESREKLVTTNINSRPKPWKKKREFVKTDVVGKLHMVLSNGVYVDTLNLMPRIQNQIRSLAAFDNPEYYKNKRLGYSNYYNFSAVYLGKDIDGYIRVPRGIRERIAEECTKAGIPIEISDQREIGRPIRVSFKGDLRLQQELAAEKLLKNSDGVLEAATAFGKTVVCSYLIAERKVNTLILLQSKDLLSQWVEELNKFLDIREEPPEYETKTGRKKKRDSAIGILYGSKNTLTGIVDIAMVSSMYSKGKFQNLKHSYGMVIVD